MPLGNAQSFSAQNDMGGSSGGCRARSLILFLVLPSVASNSWLANKRTVDCLLVEARATIQNRSSLGQTSTMIQIGAHLAWKNPNDPFGMLSRDFPILRTLLVEPQPNVFQELRTLLPPDGRTTARNCAICPESHAGGNVTFYAISDALNTQTGGDAAVRTRSSWIATQIASLNRSHILKHARWIPDIENYIVEIQVPCLTVMSLVEQEQIAPSDVVVLTIDAEGYDGKIIETVDFARVRPFLIVWEFMHIRRSDKGCEQSPYCGHILHTLERLGYHCWRDKENMYCTNPPITKACKCAFDRRHPERPWECGGLPRPGADRPATSPLAPQRQVAPDSTTTATATAVTAGAAPIASIAATMTVAAVPSAEEGHSHAAALFEEKLALLKELLDEKRISQAAFDQREKEILAEK